MKSPFKKLRDFAVSKHNLKDKASESSFTLEEESQDVTQGMQDVDDMRAQYEGLLTNAHIISGAAYDFSRSVESMASYMMETFGQFIDGEIGNVFSMLAKVQFEISKLLDLFAAHVSQTIITPTEMMMSELQQVQVMKEHYDEKRQVYNLTQKDMQKGKPKSGKGDNSNQQWALAKEDFKEQAQVLGFRLQSLKQGQSRSLITQAVRYHSAQIHLFSKGLASISAMEPVMRQLASEKNIDRILSERDVGNNGTLNNDMHREEDTPKNGGESESLTSSPTTFLDSQITIAEMSEEAEIVPRKLNANSKSAPISPSALYQKEAPTHIQEVPLQNPRHKKVSMYVLPSPSSASGRLASQTTGHEVESYKSDLAAHDVKRPLFSGEPKDDTTNQSSQMSLDHFVPTQKNTKHQRKGSTNGRLITFNELTNDGNLNSFPKIGRSFSHSGPITNKRSPNNKYASVNNASSTSFHMEQIDPLYKSGPVSGSPMPVYTSHISQNLSPSLLSPPQISELHKLPLPPSPKAANLIAHSAPLGKKTQEVPPPKSGPTSPLPPPPPGLGTRSLSIPASANHLGKLQRGNVSDAQEGFPSPPLKPIIFPVSRSMLH